MKTTQDITKAIWAVGMVGFTAWIIVSLYVPALTYLHSDMGTFGFILGLAAATLFTILVWGLLGMGLSYILTAVGFILGAITEGLMTLRKHYKRA
ncbi:hypothetical protein A4G20_05670 [Pasteurellaceae bacterium RH1A]|nr:hypothetical protein A4G20_05670 [Pasteurellaceae bacterium RH1A]